MRSWEGSDPVFSVASLFLQLSLLKPEQAQHPQLLLKHWCSCLFKCSSSLPTYHKHWNYIQIYFGFDLHRQVYTFERRNEKFRKLRAPRWAIIFPYFSNLEASYAAWHITREPPSNQLKGMVLNCSAPNLRIFCEFRRKLLFLFCLQFFTIPVQWKTSHVKVM